MKCNRYIILYNIIQLFLLLPQGIYSPQHFGALLLRSSWIPGCWPQTALGGQIGLIACWEPCKKWTWKRMWSASRRLAFWFVFSRFVVFWDFQNDVKTGCPKILSLIIVFHIFSWQHITGGHGTHVQTYPWHPVTQNWWSKLHFPMIFPYKSYLKSKKHGKTMKNPWKPPVG